MFSKTNKKNTKLLIVSFNDLQKSKKCYNFICLVSAFHIFWWALKDGFMICIFVVCQMENGNGNTY